MVFHNHCTHYIAFFTAELYSGKVIDGSISQIINDQMGIQVKHHALRHTHATKLVEAGANIKAVQTRLGHKDITTTMGTYVHHTDEMAKEAIELFEQTINKNATALYIAVANRWQTAV